MKRGKLIHLAERRAEPRADVVAHLEDLLRRAKAGEVRGIAVAVSADRGCEATSYTIGDGTIAQLVLAVRRLELRLLDHVEQGP